MRVDQWEDVDREKTECSPSNNSSITYVT